jgi:hypothetical protein
MHLASSRTRPRARSKIKRRALAILLGAALVATGAAAAWLISASGPGAGKIGSLTAPTVVQGTPSAEDALLPGGQGGVSFRINNTNTVALKLTGITPQGGVQGFDQFSSCDDAITANDRSGLDLDVPPGESVVSVPGAFSLASNADTTCQGQGFSHGFKLDFSTP